MVWWYGYVRGVIARGYQPAPSTPPAVEWVVPPPRASDDVLLVFCPTIVTGDNERSQAEAIQRFAAQLHRSCAAGTLPPCLLLIGMQHERGTHAVAVQRIRAIHALLDGSAIAFSAFCMAEFGKVKALNAALDLAVTMNARGLLQLDDDIWLEPGSLEPLYAAYAQAGYALAVGATKVGIPRPDRASHSLMWLRQHTASAVNYPHACCLLLDQRLLAPGIPARYVSVDGYICFKLLQPQMPDPFRLLRLVPEARCAHYVGGPPVQVVRRIRRILLNHHIHLADFPTSVSRCYFREVLFPGFWPLGSPPERLQPVRWALQALYFLWFGATGAELALRGLCGRPLRQVKWAAIDDRSSPGAAL